MKPWKWNGFQVDPSSVLEWLWLHARPSCAIYLCVDDLRARDGITLETDDGWVEDLRSRSFWDSLSTSTDPPRMHCAHCRRWLATVQRNEPALLPTVAQPIIIGSFLWLCDERCLRDFAAKPGRIYNPTPRYGRDEVLTVRCTHCESAIEANRVDPLVLADWFTQHVPAECSLEASRGHSR